MHERAAVTAALSDLLRESGGRVARVEAVLGPGVDPSVVTGIWEETVSGTAAADADLVLVDGADTLRCLGCGDDYGGSKLDPCPECGGDGLVIDPAPEFEVRSWQGVA